MTETQQQIERLRTLQESLDDALNKNAQEETLLAESASIKQAIAEAKPEVDLSGVAQESTLQGLKTAVENVDIVISGGVAAELVAGKQTIIKALRDRGADVTGNETLTELAQKIVESLALLPNGTTFSEAPIDFGDGIDKFTVLETNATSLERIQTSTSFRGLIAPNLTSLKKLAIGNILFAIIPQCKSAGYTYNDFAIAGGIRKLIIPPVSINGSYMFGDNRSSNSKNLYYFEFSAKLGTSINLQYWKPANALSENTDLLIKEDFDDINEPTESFASNIDKFLWYFEYHFIPCINDVSSSQTITLNSIIFNAISSAMSKEEPTKSLMQLIEDKGWTVASLTA